MNNKIKIVCIAISLTLFVGCGSAGGKSDDDKALTLSIPMEKGVPIAIEAGYKLLSNDPEAVVDIIIIDNNKTATLISGEATIEKPL